MEPSHDAWAADQSVPVSAPFHVSQTQHCYSTPTTSAPTNPYESIIEKLTGEIKSLKATINLEKREPKPPGKKPAGKSSIQPAKNVSPSTSSSARKKKSQAQTTPQKLRQAASAPPKLMKKEKPPKPHKSITKTAVVKASPKQNPQKMQNGDFPPSFLPTKSGCIKYGKLVIHLGSSFVLSQGLMARLGLSIWCPNLDEDSASLYNTEHRIAALTKFTKLAATSVYAYLKVNPEMAQNMSLLIPAYNHFLHYFQLNKYKKELKQKGKVAEEASNKKFNKNCERFPKRHRDMLEPITTHSDEKLVEAKGYYMIKTMPYCSLNANQFFCQLDDVMKNAAKQDPLAKTSLRRICQLPKKPEPSAFKMAPKGLLIDFYSLSLLPKPHTHLDKKLADSTFTKKYWEVVAEPYVLLDPDPSDDEADRSRQHNQANEEGEGIDLTQPSDGSNSDDCYKEGEEGDLYDEEEDGFVVSGSGEEGSGDGEGKDENKDDNEYDKAEDGDYTMHEIPEGEEIW
ncbi:hypothetical protein VP01_3413g3 [Puccinia sorghi]|uniref:Uncharacterized protein n=1 Tax=Puccinia sorghi TaxID=27349 RepID=A0A0L6UWG5_9BASI|nr:hypothetical protein VP01_3413g3 [Puccinia sorghi]